MNRTAWCIVLFTTSLASWTSAQMGPSQVAVMGVEKRPLNLTESLVATVEPVTRTILAAEEEGLVSERMFDEGQRVEQDAILVRMNTDLVKIQRDAAQAALESAQGVLQQAQAEQERAARELERNRSLFETRVAPEKEFLDAQTDERVASATVAVETANVAEKKAEVARLDTILRKSEVRSPLEGVIAKRHVEVGQAVRKWDPVAELVRLDPLFVRVNVPEQVISRINKGDAAQVTIDALGGKTFEGKVDQILPEADPASRTFAVKILLPNEQMLIRPGFFARATLNSRSESAFLVPPDAIVASGSQAHVVVARGGSAVLVPVVRGPSMDGKISVTGQLLDDDQVVTRGNESLRGGEQLIIMPAPGQTPTTAPSTTDGGPA